MRIGRVIVFALAGSSVVAAGAVGAHFLYEPMSDFSIAQFRMIILTNAAIIGTVFVLAYLVLSFAFFVIAANSDLLTIKRRIRHISQFNIDECREAMHSVFAKASLVSVSRKLDDVFADHSRLPFDFARVIRLEILRIYFQRLVIIQFGTVLLYAAYAALVAQFGPPAHFIIINEAPWPNIVATAVILVLGSWLWIDETVDGVTLELQVLLRGKLDVLSLASSASATDHLEINETVDEINGGPTAKLVFAYQRAISTLIDHHEVDIAEGANFRRRLEELATSMGELTDRMLPHLDRLTAEREELSGLLQKSDRDTSEFQRRWAEIVTKLDGLEKTLAHLVAPIATHQKSLTPEIKSDAESGVAAKELEALLVELKSISS